MVKRLSLLFCIRDSFHLSSPIHKTIFLEMDLSSSDEFDKICENLPVYPKARRRASEAFSQNQETDDFVAWQLNRFNRSSTVSVCDFFQSGINLMKKRCKQLFFVLFTFQILFFLAIRWKLFFIAILVAAMCNVFCMSSVSSAIYNEKITSKIPTFFSSHGVFSFLLSILNGMLIRYSIRFLIWRKSIFILTFLMFFIVSFSFFFQGCFIFEGRGLSFPTALRYSLRLMFKSLQPVQSLTLYLTYITLFALGPVTFGYSTWLASAIQSLAFLAISGSAASSSTNHIML